MVFRTLYTHWRNAYLVFTTKNTGYIELHVLHTFILSAHLYNDMFSKKNKVFHVSEKTFKDDEEKINKFLEKTGGKVLSWNGYEPKTFVMEY